MVVCGSNLVPEREALDEMAKVHFKNIYVSSDNFAEYFVKFVRYQI